MAEARYNIYNL